MHIKHQTLKALKVYLNFCHNMLKLKILPVNPEKNLVNAFKLTKKSIREIQVSKPIEDLRG